MKTAILGLLAETPIHPGAGRGMGVVDLPVAREASTDYPVIVGSSLKGALRDKAETAAMDDIDALFGKRDRAGEMIVSDGRLLLLPVRSLTASFRWATCPHLSSVTGATSLGRACPLGLKSPTSSPVPFWRQAKTICSLRKGNSRWQAGR